MSHHIASHDITWHCITLHQWLHTTLQYVTLHHIILHYITSHYITLHFIASFDITLHAIILKLIATSYITSHLITYIQESWRRRSTIALANRRRARKMYVFYCLVKLVLVATELIQCCGLFQIFWAAAQNATTAVWVLVRETRSKSVADEQGSRDGM